MIGVTHRRICHVYLAPHRGRARYCNAHVCLSVCVFVRVFAKFQSVISQPFLNRSRWNLVHTLVARRARSAISDCLVCNVITWRQCQLGHVCGRPTEKYSYLVPVTTYCLRPIPTHHWLPSKTSSKGAKGQTYNLEHVQPVLLKAVR